MRKTADTAQMAMAAVSKIKPFRPMSAMPKNTMSMGSVGKQPGAKAITMNVPAAASPKTNRFSLAAQSAPGQSVRTGTGLPGNVSKSLTVQPGANVSPVPSPASSGLGKVSSGLDEPDYARYDSTHGAPPMSNLLNTTFLRQALGAGAAKMASDTYDGPTDYYSWRKEAMAAVSDIHAAIQYAAATADDPAAALVSAAAVKEAESLASSFPVSGTPTGTQAQPPVHQHPRGGMSTPGGKIPVKEVAQGSTLLPPPPRQTHSLVPPRIGNEPPQVEVNDRAPGTLHLDALGQKVRRLSTSGDAQHINGEEMRLARARDAEHYFGNPGRNAATEPIPPGLFANQGAMKQASVPRFGLLGGRAFHKRAEDGVSKKLDELKEELREHEKKETPEDERKESKAVQRLEKALGTEAHTPSGEKKASNLLWRLA